jgi:hypothetical protein
MIALGLAGVLSLGWLGACAAFPTNAAAIKAAAPVSVTDVRGGRGGGGRWAAGGYRGGRYVAGVLPWRLLRRRLEWLSSVLQRPGLGTAAAGAAYYNQPYYYGHQCGYYPYPPCY